MTTPNGEIPEGGRSADEIAGLVHVTPPAMANPDMFDLAEAARGGFFGNILSGFLSIGAAIGQALEDLAAALFGNYDGSHPGLVTISDGMTDLNHRVELLDDVPGYAGAWMSTNRRFGAGSAYKTIPFDRRYGPEKKAHLNTSNNRMILETGSWSIHTTVVASAGGGIVTMTIGHAIRIRVRNNAGNIMIDRPFDWGHINWEHAKHFAMPVIVPPETAPWSIEVGYRHNDLRWHIQGGTNKTLLWVERKNIDTDNSGIVTDVPDGPDIT